jgi:chromosome segregation ATPase
MKRNLFVIILLLVLFFFGFFSGVLIRKNTYSEVRTEFQSQVVGLQKDLQQAEFVNKKLKLVFQTVEQKNDEIKQKNEVIRKKEDEIERLSKQLMTADNPNLVRSLTKKLNEKNKELQELRDQFDKISSEAIQAQKELQEANKMLKEKNDQIIALNNDLTTHKDKTNKEIKEQIDDVKTQINEYEEGSKFEYQGDNYKGSQKRKNRDRNYHTAYYHFQQAGAKYDMKRVYDKIVSQEVRDKIDKGGDLSTDSDLFKDFEEKTPDNQ